MYSSIIRDCRSTTSTGELIDAIANEPKVLHYLDIPIQHCNDGILAKMRRRNTKAELVELFAKLREARARSAPPFYAGCSGPLPYSSESVISPVKSPSEVPVIFTLTNITDFGKFMDPLADKCLVTAAMLWFVEVGQMPPHCTRP